MIDVKLKLLPGAKAPTYATDGASGMDLYARLDAPREVRGMGGASYYGVGSAIIMTGVCLSIPEGYEAQVRGRSGLARSHKIIVAPGTIDRDFRGEIGATLFNLGDDNYVIQPGDRIAQLVIAPVSRARLVQVDELDETERGAGGFGSTGR